MKNILDEIAPVITYGDSKTIDGKDIPLETVLTPPCEQCSRQGLDYMFSIEPADSSGVIAQARKRDGMSFGKPSIEKFLVKDLIKKGYLRND